MMLFFVGRVVQKDKNLYWRQSEVRMKHRKTGLFPKKKKKKNLSEEKQVTRLTVFLISLLVVNKCQSSNCFAATRGTRQHHVTHRF